MRNPGQCVGFLCDSTSVLEGAVLVQGASNDTVALPSAANSRSRLVGLAYQAGSSTANEAITSVINGIFAGIATGTITRGDRLVIGGATGTVQAESLTTPPDATRVGYALESVSSGERVAVLIGEVPSFSGTVVKFTSSSAILANSIVVLTAASTVIVALWRRDVAGMERSIAAERAWRVEAVSAEKTARLAALDEAKKLLERNTYLTGKIEAVRERPLAVGGSALPRRRRGAVMSGLIGM